MEIGLGLPNAVPGTSPGELLSFAVEAEQAGFASLATLDRLVFDSYDGLTALAAAAAVTQRIQLTTAILIAPLWTGTAQLAKQVATLDRLSGGRLTLGLAVGSRPDDFTAAGASHAGRGRYLDRQIQEMRRIWAGERRGFAGGIGPRPTADKGPELILGGNSPRATARAATVGDGWISGSGGPGMFAGGAAMVRNGWKQAGRPGRPRMLALSYFALGEQAEPEADRYLREYYSFAPPYADAVARNAAIGEQAVRRTVQAFRETGCDELILVPCTPEVDQIKRLAELTGELLRP